MKYLLEIYRRLPAFTATAIVLVVILYLTLVPRPLPDTGISLFQGADKIVHAAMFAALTYVATIDTCIWLSRSASMLVSLLIATASTVVGGGIELIQSGMEMGRSAEWLDFVSDAAGSVLISVMYIRRWPAVLWRVVCG